MRMTRIQVFLLGCLLIALLGPAVFSQRGGMGGGKGGKGGMGKGMFNPDDIFNRMSNGEATFDVNKVELRQWGQETVEQQREKMMSFLQSKGVSNGQMTKELYREYFEARSKDREKGMAEMGFKMLAKDAASFNVDKVEIGGMMRMMGDPERTRQQMRDFLKSKGITSGEMTKELFLEYSSNRIREFREKGDTRTEEEKKKDEDIRVREFFKTLDTNNDNVLTKEELEAGRRSRAPASSLLEDFNRYDKNRNGTIDLDEYIGYIRARTEEREKEREKRREEKEKRTEDPKQEKLPDLDVRPIVYRFGKLPKELPGWFSENDKDKDGQLGLYEWKREGKDVKEFLAMDTNGDGFLTAEEMLRYQRIQEKLKAKNGSEATAVARGPILNPAPGLPGANEQGGDRGNMFRGKGKGKGKGGNFEGKGKGGNFEGRGKGGNFEGKGRMRKGG